MGSTRAGSNPARSERISFFFHSLFSFLFTYPSLFFILEEYEIYDGPEGSYDLPKNPTELLKTRQEFPKKRPEFPKKEQSSIKESFLKKDKVSQKLNRAPKKTAELPKKERSSEKTN